VDKTEQVFVIINVTEKMQQFKYDISRIDIRENSWTDILSRKKYNFQNGEISIDLAAYDIFWLKNSSA
jgi:hypothetical protein